LRIKPLLDDQEMDLSVRYWEGAVAVYEGDVLVGRGYLELAGY
jgi:predicted secreted hydrolase